MNQQASRFAKLPSISLLLFSGPVAALLAISSIRFTAKVDASHNGQLRDFATPAKFPKLLASPPDRLAHLDIAVINLLCTEGLPTDEPVDVSKYLALLDAWAKRVQSETQRHFYKFQRNPAEFNHSEGYFRMLALVTVLQQDFGVRYNPERAHLLYFH